MFLISKAYLPFILTAVVFAAGATGFQVSRSFLFSSPSRASVTSRHVQFLSTSSTASISNNNNVTDPVNVIYAPDSSQPVTPNQLKELRKEAAKRQSRKTLVQHAYVDFQSTTNNCSDEEIQIFLKNVCQDLENHELIQIRGVSRNSKRKVFDRAEQIALDLSVMMQRDVTLVDYKGHAINLYSPSSDPQKRKIILRSSFREGQWDPKPKPSRDHRGQIVK